MTLCSPVFADNVSGTYIGAMIGRHSLSGDYAKLDQITGLPVQYNYTTVGLSAGYNYALTKRVGVGFEFGVQYAGPFGSPPTGDSAYSSLTSVPLFLVVRSDIWRGLNIFGKLGYAYNVKNSDINVSEIGTFKFCDESFNPVWGAGIGYQIGHFNIYAQYQYNYMTSPEIAYNIIEKIEIAPALSGGVKTVSLGVSYGF